MRGCRRERLGVMNDIPPVAPVAPRGLATPSHLIAPGPSKSTGTKRRWILAIISVPIVLLVVLITGWAVDTGAHQVPRNTSLAGVAIGGLGEDELAGRIAETSVGFASTPVEIVAGDSTYSTTAEALGLTIDEGKTTDGALNPNYGTPFLLRPFVWAKSFWTEHQAPLQFQVNTEQVAVNLVELQGEDRVEPTEPSVELVDGGLKGIPGKDGEGIDSATAATALMTAAQVAADNGEATIRLTVKQSPLPPLGSEEAAASAASTAEALTAEPIEIRAGNTSRTIKGDTMRSWVTLTSAADGTVAMAFDPTKVSVDLQRAFKDVDGHPVDASFTLGGNGQPVIVADQPGTICCGEGASTTILAALNNNTRSVDLELVPGPALFTVAAAKAYGIVRAVGGNNAWRDGAPTTAGPGFTTYHAPTGARITNIHRIADLVRGAVIAPGATFSINDHVGKRTAADGFVEAGAISNGAHVNEIGGGISQFATTTFNAAYFAGLPITTSQAHSEYFDRYPRGREATMGFPNPDLAFTNDTPYGIMIWTSYTGTSLTVTLYSTPYANGAQTDIVEAPAGRCTAVTTTRTITYPDGNTANDKFRARYRPSGSTTC
ncbi:MAG: hypothetical protein EXQ71_03300 [Acidimicrobiia bacterium]|nr:hypothetical protein [Acidimicrobiia bacterium]